MARSRSRERELDRLEDRLLSAPEGLHSLGGPAADDAQLAEFGDAALLWRRWDGIEFANGESRIFTVEECSRQTELALEEERIRRGERLVGAMGRDSLVLASDPWEAGAEVWLIEEDGSRHPFASSVARLAEMLLAQTRVTLDDEGEYRDEIFGDDGELTPSVERKLQRRRLDRDEDSPYARFRLAQLLRAAGELSGARRELELTLRRAPDYLWAQLELGRTCVELGEREVARKAFGRVAELAEDDGTRAYALAWKAMLSTDEERRTLAQAVEQLYPGFAIAQEHGARAALERDDAATAAERIALGLAVTPSHIGLLDLKKRVPSDAVSG